MDEVGDGRQKTEDRRRKLYNTGRVGLEQVAKPFVKVKDTVRKAEAA